MFVLEVSFLLLALLFEFIALRTGLHTLRIEIAGLLNNR